MLDLKVVLKGVKNKKFAVVDCTVTVESADFMAGASTVPQKNVIFIF
jgi:hypothetical protein